MSSSLTFIKPINKNLKRPKWRGIPSVSFTIPAVAYDIPGEIEPSSKMTKPAEEIKTRESIEVGRVVIVVAGEKAGCRACIVGVLPKGMVKIAGPKVHTMEISQDYIISTSTKLNVSDGANETQVASACDPELLEYLNTPFRIGRRDKVHLMKF